MMLRKGMNDYGKVCREAPHCVVGGGLGLHCSKPAGRDPNLIGLLGLRSWTMNFGLELRDLL